MRRSWDDREIVHEFWPEAVVLPTMSAGATDGSYLRNAGIPNLPVIPASPAISTTFVPTARTNEFLVKSFFEGDEYLYRLVKMLSGGGS